MSSVRYGIRLGDLKENWFLCFPIKHSTHTRAYAACVRPRLSKYQTIKFLKPLTGVYQTIITLIAGFNLPGYLEGFQPQKSSRRGFNLGDCLEGFNLCKSPGYNPFGIEVIVWSGRRPPFVMVIWSSRRPSKPLFQRLKSLYDDDVFYLFLQKQKIEAKLHIDLYEGTYHKRFFRGPSTNDMRK